MTFDSLYQSFAVKMTLLIQSAGTSKNIDFSAFWCPKSCVIIYVLFEVSLDGL